jgi:hypothetical protein
MTEQTHGRGAAGADRANRPHQPHFAYDLSYGRIAC